MAAPEPWSWTVNEHTVTTRVASATLLCALLTGGCATIETANKVRPHSPRFFAGTRLDLAAIESDRDTLDHYSSYDILPPSRPQADLPFSVLADTALFPFAVLYTITEPVVWFP